MPKYLFAMRSITVSTFVVEAPDEQTAQQWMDERDDECDMFHSPKLVDWDVYLAGVLEGDDELPVDVTLGLC